MVPVALAFLMAFSGGNNEPLKYEAAFAKANDENKPLMVVVGARWCAACQILKKETVQPMKEAGALKKVVVTFVDKDDRPELAEKLMKGETLPQIVVYSKKTGAWKRYSLTGLQSKKRMGELLARVEGKTPNAPVLR